MNLIIENSINKNLKPLDGSTMPYPPQTRLMRSGLTSSSINFTLWLFILILFLLLLILFYLCYQKCKQQRARSRVGSSDANQRLVVGVDAQHTTLSSASQIEGTDIKKKEANDGQLAVPLNVNSSRESLK